MLQAIKEARKAIKANEIPVGAIITKNKEIIAKGFNKCISLCDPTAHAENIVLRNAGKKLKNYRLNNCSIYVTMEPCIMCIGALINARIKKIIFGTFDKKNIVHKFMYNEKIYKSFNHKIEIICADNHHINMICSNILKDFFKKKRAKK